MSWSSRVVKESKKKSDTISWDPKTCSRIQSTSSRANPKVDGPKDLPTKVEIGEHRREPRKKVWGKGPIPVNEKKKPDTTYQPFCDDGLRDRACEQSDGPRAGSWPNWLIHLCCFAGTGRLHKPFAGESARPLAAGRREPQWAPSRARELPESWPSWTARLNRAEGAKTRSATCFRESSQGADWWRGITWGWRGRKDILGGTPMGTLFCPWKKGPSTSRWLVQGTDE